MTDPSPCMTLQQLIGQVSQAAFACAPHIDTGPVDRSRRWTVTLRSWSLTGTVISDVQARCAKKGMPGTP